MRIAVNRHAVQRYQIVPLLISCNTLHAQAPDQAQGPRAELRAIPVLDDRPGTELHENPAMVQQDGGVQVVAEGVRLDLLGIQGAAAHAVDIVPSQVGSAELGASGQVHFKRGTQLKAHSAGPHVDVQGELEG